MGKCKQVFVATDSGSGIIILSDLIASFQYKYFTAETLIPTGSYTFFLFPFICHVPFSIMALFTLLFFVGVTNICPLTIIPSRCSAMHVRNIAWQIRKCFSLSLVPSVCPCYALYAPGILTFFLLMGITF